MVLSVRALKLLNEDFKLVACVHVLFTLLFIFKGPVLFLQLGLDHFIIGHDGSDFDNFAVGGHEKIVCKTYLLVAFFGDFFLVNG